MVKRTNQEALRHDGGRLVLLLRRLLSVSPARPQAPVRRSRCTSTFVQTTCNGSSDAPADTPSRTSANARSTFLVATPRRAAFSESRNLCGSDTTPR